MTTAVALLNPENYRQGFLVDEDLMAGVTQNPEDPSTFIAFVLKHTTGEYLGYQPFPALEPALQVINQIQRGWTFERMGGCGGGNCGGGQCGGGNCGKGGGCSTGACPV